MAPESVDVSVARQAIRELKEDDEIVFQFAGDRKVQDVISLYDMAHVLFQRRGKIYYLPSERECLMTCLSGLALRESPCEVRGRTLR